MNEWLIETRSQHTEDETGAREDRHEAADRHAHINAGAYFKNYNVLAPSTQVNLLGSLNRYRLNIER